VTLLCSTTMPVPSNALVLPAEQPVDISALAVDPFEFPPAFSGSVPVFALATMFASIVAAALVLKWKVVTLDASGRQILVEVEEVMVVPFLPVPLRSPDTVPLPPSNAHPADCCLQGCSRL